ncbi:hypothetical protein TYRP_016954, partial [Tyrophagus putrescentiae]
FCCAHFAQQYRTAVNNLRRVSRAFGHQQNDGQLARFASVQEALHGHMNNLCSWYVEDRKRIVPAQLYDGELFPYDSFFAVDHSIMCGASSSRQIHPHLGRYSEEVRVAKRLLVAYLLDLIIDLRGRPLPEGQNENSNMQREEEMMEAASEFLQCFQVMSIELYRSLDDTADDNDSRNVHCKCKLEQEMNWYKAHQLKHAL